MPDIWISSDLHLGHQNILYYCNRPFKSCGEMEEAILDRFNSCIKRGDVLYLLGDIAWTRYDLSGFFSRLNTKDCHLILGNHDRKKEKEYLEWFSTVGESRMIRMNGHKAFLYHYPVRSWKGKGQGVLHLYGHTHGKIPGLDRSMDVGVDTNKFFPYSAEELITTLTSRPIYGQDI